MLNIFIGYDPRQPVSYNVLAQSILMTSTTPVAITPIVLQTLPLTRQGLTPFTFSRFLVPFLMNYQGWALFLDIDMLLLSDITELFKMADDKYALMVVKNKIKFEWASAMLYNCSHPANRVLTPEFVSKAQNLHQISWLKDEFIGDLPSEWNHLVGYDRPRPDAKLVHYTQGVPAYELTSDSEYAREWREECQLLVQSLPWADLMGKSVHAATDSNGNIVPRYKVEPPK